MIINDTLNREKRIYYLYDEEKWLAINWLIKKIEKIDKPINDLEQFKVDIMEFINKSNEQLGNSALICTSQTFFEKKLGRRSLKSIFENHDIDIKGYMLSINVTRKGVFVSDGFGSGRRKIDSID